MVIDKVAMQEEINEALTVIVEDMRNPSGPEIDAMARALMDDWRTAGLSLSYDPETQVISVE